jgi:peptidoglycan hydrolase-like protein with peptidoglycan-binding domain
MNKLLRFNPEPFEDFAEPQGEYDCEVAFAADEMEEERGRRGPRGGTFSSRRGGIPRAGRQRAGRASASTGSMLPGIGARRFEPPRKGPSRHRRPIIRPPWLPFIPPAWPGFPTPEPPQDAPPGRDAPRAEPSGGAPTGGQPSQPEPSEAPSEYVRWVQSCLNQVMGLQLPIDGIMNTQTRSAIRSFQERRGLHIDGLVGPETERALIDACKTASPSTPSVQSADSPGMQTHCDIVTAVRPGHLLTVGGNVNNSVAQKTLRTDANGFITDPEYFAVIRIGAVGPSTPRVTPPTPMTSGTGSAPRLLKQESTPPGTTLYVSIDLGIVDQFGITAAPMTGIFMPEGYGAGSAVDVILYLHGHKGEQFRRQAIDQYWNSRRFPYGALRECTNASRRNVMLVAPTLGSRSEAGRLLKPGGLDAYLDQVLAALRAYSPHSRGGTTPSLGNLILACHSGGGKPMRQLAGGQNRALSRARECWGFDCTYNHGDDAFWAGWARSRPNATVYIYYVVASQTARLAESLRDKRVPNALVKPSRDSRHNYVPTTHWVERVQGASFLTVRAGGAVHHLGPPRLLRQSRLTSGA